MVQLAGECKTRVRDYHSDTRYNYNSGRYETVTVCKIHEAKQEYINTTLLLFQPLNHTLQPGIYSFPFRFSIPKEIPCTFSGTHGKVRYFIRYRTNHCPGDSYITFSKDKETVGIVVLSADDPNTLPHIRQPVKFSGSKTFGIFTKSLPLFVEVSLPKQVYVPGEIIHISARISNQSDQGIKRCEIWIKQKTYYTAPGALETEETVRHFAKMTRTGFGADTQELWNNLPYFVPALPPTDLPHCAYISVKYWLRIKFVPTRGIDLDLEEMIAISTVPVKSVNHLPDFISGEIVPSAPPVEFDTGYQIESNSDNSHIIAVKFCEEASGKKDPLIRSVKLLSGIMDMASNYGTESCRPRYPVFDLQQDCVEKDFEFV